MSSTPRGPVRLEIGVLVLLKGEKNQYFVPFLINTKIPQSCMLWWTILRSLASLGFPSPSPVFQHTCRVVRQPGAVCVESEDAGGHFPPCPHSVRRPHFLLPGGHSQRLIFHIATLPQPSMTRRKFQPLASLGCKPL